jgi:hypothetical protein
VGDFTVQEHDFEPGIADNGLFWTIPIGNGMVDAEPTSGAGRFRGQSVKVTDFHDFFTAVGFGSATPVPGRADYDVSWAGGGPTVQARDTAYEYVGEYVTSRATITFTVSNADSGVVYTSGDLAAQTNPDPAGVGTERSGVFFS